MKKFFIIVAVVLTYTSTFADEPLKWYSFDKGLAKAQVENKILLVDFYTDWCGWCKKMDKSTYGDDNVRKILNENFIAAKLNPEKEGSVTFNGQTVSQSEFAKAVKVTGYPTTGFFRNDSVFIGKVSGYFEAEKFIEILHSVLKAKKTTKN